ncbi:hypothetical protein BPOR_0493g00120 [Botrytis porri]|uniref:Uncharacterized protein n=1 Tax=Botrytis porri TaxID=87229 RepID=A0A4Z1KRH0_9HELO|nr:hypothetical protein BPOR_0493g00120 [Botrytis porri]
MADRHTTFARDSERVEWEKMNLGDPPDTPISEINARKRAWHKDSLFRRFQLGEFKKPKLATARSKHG